MLDWTKYTEIASKFQYKVKPTDREDMRQDIILKLAEIESKYNGSGESLITRRAEFHGLCPWVNEKAAI